MFLEAHFGEVEFHMGKDAVYTEQDLSYGEPPDAPCMVIRVDGVDANIDLLSLVQFHLSRPIELNLRSITQIVSSTQEHLKKRVEIVLGMALATISSLAESYTSGVSLGATEAYADAKEEDMDMRVEDNSYLPRRASRKKRPLGLVPKEEVSEDEEGSDESDEMLEVIG